jgi:hypothetical protein
MSGAWEIRVYLVGERVRRGGRGCESRTEEVPPVDAMLIAQDTQDRAIVEVSFAGCTHRGLRNGRDTSRVSQDLLQAILESLHIGYAFSEL